jgi:palmitoyltransferase
MDHHCPWVNNCVGFGNQKLFVLFMSYVSVASVTTLLVHLWGFYRWYVFAFTNSSGRRWKAPPSPYLAFGLQCAVMLESAGFLAFVAPFLSDQYEAIVTNSTLVETFQETHGVRTTFNDHLKQVMGDDWRWWWVPVPSGVIPNYLEPVIPDREEVMKTEFVSAMPRPVKEDMDGDHTEPPVKEEAGLRQRA